MTRILCVHGIGQNAAIFEALTESIRHFLPDYYDYTFFDGHDECEPAPGIGEIFPGPYYCQYMKFYPSYVRQSQEYIMSIIEDEGPFDGVLSYSQGAACVASMILQHEHDFPQRPPLFRFAIFMNGSAPICATNTSGYDVTPGYRNVSLDDYLGATASKTPRRGSESNSDSSSNSSNSPRIKSSCLTDEDGAEQTVRWWIPQADRERINFPTVHIHGASDGWLKESNDLLAMCDEETAMVWKHSGGHELPKGKEVVRKVAELIEKAAVKGETMMY